VYLEGLGRELSGNGVAKSRRENLESGMRAIHAYEKKLSEEMYNALRSCGAEIYGVKDPAQFDRRVPTFLFNLPGVAPAKVVEALASAGIGARDGHMYSPRLMKRLGLAQESGAVRASLVHYNTSAEIEQFRQVLAKIAGK
jgi:selenocysteine lyase/cysteine desulfurase